MLLCLLTAGVIGAPGGCLCTKELDPICGVNEITYNNLCLLQCAGVRLRHAGECQPRKICGCPKILAPVCGTDGLTYENECMMTCNNAMLAYEGIC